jgi:hypothetical protein
MIAYSSVLNVPPSEWKNALVSIAKKSYENNRKSGVTGILIVAQGKCVQIIEGEDQAIQDTYARISNDPRHKEINLLMNNKITKREFPQWELSVSMLDRMKPVEGEIWDEFLDAYEEGNMMSPKELSDLLRKLLMS